MGLGLLSGIPAALVAGLVDGEPVVRREAIRSRDAGNCDIVAGSGSADCGPDSRTTRGERRSDEGAANGIIEKN